MRMLFFVFFLFFIGCSKNNDYVIASDRSKWDNELVPKLAKLTPQERSDITVWMGSVYRMCSSGYYLACSHDYVPYGVTIKQALTDINDYKNKENAEIALRNKNSRAESQDLISNKFKEAILKNKKLDEFKKILDFEYLGWYDQDKEIKHRFIDKVILRIRVKNNTKHDIGGVLGRVIFYDGFDRKLIDHYFELSDIIGSNNHSDVDIEIKKFSSELSKLRDVKQDSIRVYFDVGKVRFADGRVVSRP